MRKYVMEAVGSMFLLLVISLIGNPIAIGATLTVLVYMGWHISGGHYNPAISLAVWLRGKLSAKDLKFYITFQVIGGLAATAVYWMLMGKKYYPVPGGDVGYWKILLLELIFTFLLVFVALTVSMAPKFKGNTIYGIAIGFTLLAIAFLGGTYNPMVSMCPAIFDVLSFGKTAIKYAPIYAVGSLSGGVVASYFYFYIYGK